MLQQQQEKINKITPTVRATSPVAPAVPNREDILQHRGQSTVENAKFQSSAKFVAAQNSRAISSSWEKWLVASDRHNKGTHFDE
jgi:hypothetical protein